MKQKQPPFWYHTNFVKSELKRFSEYKTGSILHTLFLLLFLCFIIAAPFLLCQYAKKFPSSEIKVTKRGLVIPVWNIPPEDISVRRLDLSYQNSFRYQNRYYYPYNLLYNTIDFQGTFLGTVDTDSSFSEKMVSVYAPDGIDPSFMVCLWEDSEIPVLYIHNNDITLRTGADLLEDRLSLSEHKVEAYCAESPSLRTPHSLLQVKNEYLPVIEQFLENLKQAPFLRIKDTPLFELQKDFFDRSAHPLYLKMENGVMINLRLYEEGYVCFDGFWNVCLQVPETSLSPVLELLADKDTSFFVPFTSTSVE